jgi:hypothetical protein
MRSQRGGLVFALSLAVTLALVVVLGAQQAAPSIITPAQPIGSSGASLVQLTEPAGTGTARASVGGTLVTGFDLTSCGTAQLSNVGTSETDLCIYTMPANTLATNGNKVRITAWGAFAANTNAKTVRLYFGAAVLSTIVTASAAVSGWTPIGTVLRTGAATQVAGGFGMAGATGAGSVGTQLIAVSPTETLSGAVVIKVTGQSGTAGADITLVGLFVEWVP